MNPAQKTELTDRFNSFGDMLHFYQAIPNEENPHTWLAFHLENSTYADVDFAISKVEALDKPEMERRKARKRLRFGKKIGVEISVIVNSKQITPSQKEALQLELMQAKSLLSYGDLEAARTSINTTSLSSGNRGIITGMINDYITEE